MLDPISIAGSYPKGARKIVKTQKSQNLMGALSKMAILANFTVREILCFQYSLGNFQMKIDTTSYKSSFESSFSGGSNEPYTDSLPIFDQKLCAIY